jgi:lipooligosaccharide transport system ATP-binding protein
VSTAPGSTGPLIHARDLTKRFGALTAVDGIDFDVAPGEAFGFLGPNGAGKTSAMRMIGCVSPVTSGTLQVLGMDPATDGAAIKSRLGVVPQQDTLDMELSVRGAAPTGSWTSSSSWTGPTARSSRCRVA